MDCVEIRCKIKKLRILFVSSALIAYEQSDGSLILNDEIRGVTYHPDESYEHFRERVTINAMV